MDITLLITLATLAEQCLNIYSYRHIRTRAFLTYTKPEVYQPLPNNHPELSTYPIWHQLWKKNLKRHNNKNRSWAKRVPEYIPTDPADNTNYANARKLYSKRFFLYSPFVLDKTSKSTPYSMFKPTYVDRSFQPSSQVQPFVDHFTGVRSWAIPLYKQKQTEPHSAAANKQLQADEKDQRPADSYGHEMDDLAVGRELDRVEKLKLIKEILQDSVSPESVDDSPKDDKNQANAQSEDQSLSQDSGDYMNDNDKGTFDSVVNPSAFEDGKDSDFPHAKQLSFDVRTSYSHNTKPFIESTEAPKTMFTDTDNVDAFDKSGFLDVPHNNQLGFAELVNKDDEGFATPSTRSDPGSYFGFDDSFADTTYDDYSWENGFVTDDDDCEGIETKSCASDMECNCFGIYFCIEGRCQITAGDIDDTEEHDDPFVGFWHEGPVDIH